jgi:hypothetical protein
MAKPSFLVMLPNSTPLDRQDDGLFVWNVDQDPLVLYRPLHSPMLSQVKTLETFAPVRCYADAPTP